MIKDLILKNRSYRRFYEEFNIGQDILKELIDLARLSPSAANLQPLKYFISCDSDKNSLIFPHLRWAGYLKDWPGPSEREKPSAYIIILCDTDIAKTGGCDHGIAAQTILLGATEKGLGGCIFASIEREGLRKDLNIPEKYEILLVIAIGKPAEKVVIEEINNEGNIKYWRDKDEVHHVPKRSLNDIILN